MSTVPKLLLKGHLVHTKGTPPQKELDEIVPINFIINWIKSRRKLKGIKNRVLILESDTGTGKSSILPPELYHTFKDDNRYIVSAQPRVFNAKQIPKDILPYHSSKALAGTGREPLIMGKNIGYQTGEFVKMPHSGLLFTTYGTILGQINYYNDEEILNKFQFIIIDEAHEKDMNSTFLHYILRDFVAKNADNIKCPMIIITSATLVPEHFMKYYGVSNHIKIRGLTYKVDEHYLKYDTGNYISSIVDTIKKIHVEKKKDFNKSPVRDIIVFIGGINEIMAIKAAVMKLNTTDEYCIKYPILPLELSRKVIVNSLPDQKYIYRSIKRKINGIKYYRRVIISTNVGETGITYPFVKYVIDSGFYKTMEYYPDFDYFILIKRPVSHDIRLQRRGRAGRITAGEVYYMYSKETCEKLNNSKPAEMIIEDITFTLLKLIVYLHNPDSLSKSPIKILENIKPKKINLLKLDLIDQPPAISIQMALDKLYLLGYVDEKLQPTLFSICAARITRVDVEQLRIVFAAYNWGASVDDCIIISSLIPHRLKKIYPNSLKNKLAEFKNNFAQLMINKDQDYYYSKIAAIMGCDFMQFLLHYYVAADLLKSGKELKYAAEYVGISPSVFADILQYRDRIFVYLGDIGVKVVANEDKSLLNIINNTESDIDDIIAGVKKLKHCLYEGLKLKIAKWENNSYYTVKSHMQITTEFKGYDYIMYDILEVNTYGYARKKTVDKISALDGYIPL